MALKGSFVVETSGGTVVYTRAEIFNQGGSPDNVNLSVLFSEPLGDKAHPTAMQNYSFTVDLESGVDLWTQGYAHLKTLVDFAGAEDA